MMTLGKKLSNLRKVAGLTQQQLAEHLNLSAQAVSKWENDLSEPDLSTLKNLARLYNISVDQLLQLDGEEQSQHQTIDADAVAASVGAALGEQLKVSAPVGYCKDCGIAVTDENLGAREPVVLCAKCVKARREAEERQKEAQKRAIEEKRRAEKKKEEDEIRERQGERKSAFLWASVVGGIFLVLDLIVFFYMLPSGVGAAFGFLGSAMVTTCCVFMAVAAYSFDNTFLNDMAEFFFTSSIRWPGLIFSFDLDGFAWLIGMKILFAVLGFLFGILMTLLGLFLCLLLSPIAFPLSLYRNKRGLDVGEFF